MAASLRDNRVCSNRHYGPLPEQRQPPKILLVMVLTGVLQICLKLNKIIEPVKL